MKQKHFSQIKKINSKWCVYFNTCKSRRDARHLQFQFEKWWRTNFSSLSTDIETLMGEYYERKSILEKAFENGLLNYRKKLIRKTHLHKWKKFKLK